MSYQQLIYNPLFTDKYLDNKLQFKPSDLQDFNQRKDALRKWVSLIRKEEVFQKTEKELQPSFYSIVFEQALGYKHLENLIPEKSTNQDATKPDASLGFYSNDNQETHVVVELKDANTSLDKPQNRKNDKRTPVEQAFGYVSKVGGNCKWVIVSNFVEFRLYSADDSSKYQSFNLNELFKSLSDGTKETPLLTHFLAILSKERLINNNGASTSEILLANRQEEEKNITNGFYKKYKTLRFNLFNHLKEENQGVDELIILNKTQKLLDRIIFVCFCEDLNLLPYKTFRGLLDEIKARKFDRSDTKIWESVKTLFDCVDKGYPSENINKFNGGLFKKDALLDSLVIKDEILKDVINIEEYDFDSEVDVNILGHIFEQSISDLEEIKAKIEDCDFNEKKGKRKKDGVFYTPEHITRYIVDESIGGWLDDRKSEIGFENLPTIKEDEWPKIKAKKVQKNSKLAKAIKEHLVAWRKLREHLNNIKVLDPACGSGSFLVQVFNFLKNYGILIEQEIAKLEGQQMGLFSYDAQILSNNIYGVDLNEESIEITKLALWLKTANKNEELTTLDNNIKCGNSLISSTGVAGDSAFDWNKEFSEVMQNGGFDVIVGNPPYGANLSSVDKDYIEKHYPSFKGNYDIYSAFIDIAFDLCKNKGYWGFITPVSWQSGFNYKNTRERLKKTGRLLIGIKLPYDTFSDAYVDTGIYIVKNEIRNDYSSLVYDFPIKQKITGSLEREILLQELPSSYWQDLESLKIVFNPNFYTLSRKIKKVGVGLGSISESVRGILADKSDIFENPKVGAKRYFTGNAYRYELQAVYSYVRYGDNLKEKPKDYKFFEQDRILIRRLINRKLRIMGLIAKEEFVNKKDLYNLIVTNSDYEIGYLLSIINSKLSSFLMTKGSTASTKDDFSQITLNDIRSIKIPEASKGKQSSLSKKVQKIQNLNEELHEKSFSFLKLLQLEFNFEKIGRNLENWFNLEFADFTKEIEKKTKPEKLSLSQKSELMQFFEKEKVKATELKDKINQIDREIDQMVYKLYKLTDKEIEIVESD